MEGKNYTLTVKKNRRNKFELREIILVTNSGFKTQVSIINNQLLKERKNSIMTIVELLNLETRKHSRRLALKPPITFEVIEALV